MKTKALFFLMLISCLSYAQFAAVPTLKDKPWRFFIGVTESLGFDNFRHTQTELKTSIVHKVCPGFDTGVALHGGFGASPNYPGILGIDFMGRYLDDWSSLIFGGAQIIAGYSYNGLGLESRSAEVASTIPITLGPIIGVTASQNVRIFLFPALELGRKDYATEKSFWGTQVGCQMGLGMIINLGGPVLSLEIKPRHSWMFDPNRYQFSIDTTAALVWNF